MAGRDMAQPVVLAADQPMVEPVGWEQQDKVIMAQVRRVALPVVEVAQALPHLE
jgi:hypothetical protein